MTPPVSPTGPEFRPFSVNDLPLVAALYCEVFSAPPWNEAWTGDTASALLRDTLNTPGSLGLLAWQDGQLVGCTLGYEELSFDGVHFYLKEMFVHPTLQRRGIGARMLHELKRTLGHHGVRRIYLLTERDSAAADFYGAQGFYQSPRIMMACRLEQE
jgi:aminoglycoside 6'-N-acetyltransferase I